MSRVLFTTSWDDGHPLDLQIAEILARHGCRGTFYVPCTNPSGRPVLSPVQLRRLAAATEIGSHTLDHCYLDTASRPEIRRQIVEGKQRLEELLGAEVTGFCYPGGRQNAYIRGVVKEAGFAYARSIEGFCLDLRRDRFRMPTTLQIFPHSPLAYLRNFASRGGWAARWPALGAALRHGKLSDRLSATLDLACRRGGVLHVWGHSWEIEEEGLWGVLEDFLRAVSERIPPDARVENRSLHSMVSASWRADCLYD